MFVELIEYLRCPREHAETTLVASADETEARHIVRGALGCPVCGAEFSIENGITVFEDPGRVVAEEGASAEIAMRLAAFLELTDANGFAVLVGAWCTQADRIVALSDTPLVLVNPPANLQPSAAAVILTRDVIPFAAGSARGVALDRFASDALVRSAVHCLRPGGRVIAPIAVPVPEGITEITRDASDWVGEKIAAAHGAPPRLVTLKRSGR